ncbi:hypothetical protein C0995_008687 [Termitomyces sp. Mi166|nr:hypothetical protein C0995_008687 [Termitomyces sp. Mi166\
MAGTGNSTPQAGDTGVIPVSQAGEMPEASVYRPPHMREESDTQNVSVSVGILPSLVYLDPSNFIRQRWSNVESLPQQQGGAYAHSTPLRPTQVMSSRTERVGDYQSVIQPTQYQVSIPEWSGRGNVTASEVPQVRYAPQEGKSLATGLEDHPARESSDEEENDRLKSTFGHQGIMQKHLQLYVLKHMQMLANMGQHVPEVELTEYIELYLQIFELELKEYMKHKEARATARSTATLAESVDYNTIRRQ